MTSLRALLPVYLKIGLLSFGGPAGQIALMQQEIVAQRQLMEDATFQRGLNVAMLLPGPEAQQLATWLGWRLHGLAGGLAAGLAFILPGTALMIALAALAATRGDEGIIAAIFYGIQPAVLVIVGRAVIALGQRALNGVRPVLIALLAFIALAVLGLPFPLVVAGAALAGFMLPSVPAPDVPPQPMRWGGTLKIIAGFTLLIGAVFLVIRWLFGPEPFDEVAELFLSAAFVSFGGAYALLPYVADRAVETYGWLSPEQMLNGLAIAEATPGPLILVNVYAGYFAGAGGTASVATALLACFYTFAPSFMLILAAAPHVEAMQRQRWIRQALAGVSAAVVGVVLNLALYLGVAALLPGGEIAWLKVGLLGLFAIWSWWRAPGVLPLIVTGMGTGIGLWGLGLI